MEAEGELLLRLRSGDERAFVGLVERHQEQMLRLAASFVPSRAAEGRVAAGKLADRIRGRSRLRQLFEDEFREVR